MDQRDGQADAGVRQVIAAVPAGVAIRVKVVPGASRSKVAGLLGDRLKVAVAAPPEAGKANAALCELLAGVLEVGKRAAQVTSGQTQPRKTVTVSGVTVEMAVKRLGAVIDNRL